MARPLIADGHLDVAMNALELNRDQTRSVEEIREREKELLVSSQGAHRVGEKGRGVNTTSLPEMRRGDVFLGFATLMARTAHPTNDYEGYDGQEICYAAARGQLAYYELLESRGALRMLRDWEDVREHLDDWRAYAGGRASEAAGDAPGDAPPVGIVLAMEGADPILAPEQLEEWWSRGLRMVSLAHYGRSSYADGTGCDGGLTERGPAMLEALEEAGVILDLTHLTDQAFWEALEHFSGPVAASHSNSRALVSGGRQLDDEQLQAIVDRDGVVGVAMDTWMLQEGWEKGVYNEVTATMETVVDHVEHVCDLAGDARHVAIGSDLDGGFGLEQVPRDLDTVADLQRVPEILRARGYDEDDVDRVAHGNWLRLLEEAWT
ncbi:MAG: dipeptidase [Haloferacaceae archaeon]